MLLSGYGKTPMLIVSNERAPKVVQPLLFNLSKEDSKMYRNRAVAFASLLVLLLAMGLTQACSMNRVLPEAADEEAMELEVRAAITAVAPGKTMEVDVTEGGHVKLSGHADSADQRTAIVSRVKEVKGVTSVDGSGIHVQ